MRRLFTLSFIVLLAACTSGNSGGGSSSSSASVSSVSSSASHEEMIKVTSPKANATVKSPLVITGEAPGPWFFEASFPVVLLDEKANEIASGIAEAQGEWMTEKFVPFKATLTFTTSAAQGSLVLRKDNPSGDPMFDASITIPVRF